jgi:hypothetical protein
MREREGPSAGRWEGEGLTFLKLFQNRFDDAVCVREHIVVPEPKHVPPLVFQPDCAHAISLAVRMLAAVGFDDQAVPRAGEIDDERSDRKLPAKAVAAQSAVAQYRPKPTLGVGRISTQSLLVRPSPGVALRAQPPSPAVRERGFSAVHG